jgi:hypothetical protein
MANVGIRFTQNSLPYKIGDVAGFESKLADKYVKAGLAEKLSATPGEIKAVESPDEKKNIDQAPVDKMIKKSPKKK